jgi:hypothetical protein
MCAAVVDGLAGFDQAVPVRSFSPASADRPFGYKNRSLKLVYPILG